jgi:hypothetical protein
MAGFVSVRLSKEERKRLLALKAERGCKSISQVVRLMLGFPRGTDEGLEGADDIDSVSKLWEAVIQLISREDDEIKVITKIARQVGVPMDRYALNIHEDDYVPDPTPLRVPETGPIDLRVPMEHRNGDRHPVMPEGFSRG